MSASTSEALVVVPELDDSDFGTEDVHWACCEDEEIAQCGVDLSDDEAVDVEGDEVAVNCETCLRLGGRTVDPCPANYCHVSALRSLKGPAR